MRSLNVKEHFRTKAETLAFLQGKLTRSTIPSLLYFSVSDWERQPATILKKISTLFGPRLLAVRSSAWNESSEECSMAGHYRTSLDTPNNEAALTEAIHAVIASFDDNPRNQVLVQEMARDIQLSGVVSTRDLNTGAPYYIVDYDDQSCRTDLITRGFGEHKTIVLHHDTPPCYVALLPVSRVLDMTRELEQLLEKSPLNIEFAQARDGTLFLLQVRSVPVARNWNCHVPTRVNQALRDIEHFIGLRSGPRPGLAGATTILGQMPDWNPAELIGSHPRPLAASLFGRLITDSVWRRARARMGYRVLPRRPLMVVLAGRPYIDVRNSFNSFLPRGLPERVESAIVDAWLQRLREHPELHDKVEFEVAQTVLNLTFETAFHNLYGGALPRRDFDHYAECLRRLTNQNVSLSKTASLHRAWNSINRLERMQSTIQAMEARAPLQRVFQLLDECCRHGTFPFAIIARHAFIAEALLRSAVANGAFQQERLDEFKRSLTTVATRMRSDFAKVLQGQMARRQFLQRYGHLRPGSFDILSRRYDQRSDLFRAIRFHKSLVRVHSRTFALTAEESRSLNCSIGEARLTFSAEDLLQYAALAIASREYAKFVFSRHLSDTLERIAEWGESLGLSRDDLSFLTLDDLAGGLSSPILEKAQAHFKELAEARRTYAYEMRGLRLGHILRGSHDLYVVPLDVNSVNFITFKAVEGRRVPLENRTSAGADLFKKIVCIENADPGFDWIFAKGIGGLVTKFGGANSHMAIRCAEMAIPAAIGVGELLFEHLNRCTAIELNCREKVVRPLYG